MAEIVSLLAASVLAVLLFSRLGLGSVLGYLAAGAVIGPSGLALVTDADNMRHIGEFGVVFLLFLIGLEIKPQRLWVMRRLVFGLGGLQVAVTGVFLAGLIYLVLGVEAQTALIIGFGLALSSTAFGVQILTEKQQTTSNWGRISFSVLLFQDLAVVPLLILLPLLALGEMQFSVSMGFAVLQAMGIFISVLVVGRYAISPLLNAIAYSKSGDAFVATALLLVLGFAWAMELIGLSMAMGAFIAGVLLSESEYKHQIEADVMPFRGLLLGLFFMSVGMTFVPTSAWNNLGVVVLGALALVSIKAVVLIGLARLWRVPLSIAVKCGFLLSQAGEFGFVLFSLAQNLDLLPVGMMETLISVIVLSMILTPVMVKIAEKLARRLKSAASFAMETSDPIPERPVIIAGFGRVGEVIAGMLRAVDVACVAIDMDAARVARGRELGHSLVFGDASRPEILRAIGADRARLMVVTLDDHHMAEGVVRTMQRLYPEVPVHVRARDWGSADHLTALGASHAIPETVEASLRLGAAALKAAGVGEDERRALFEDLREEDYAKLREHQKA
ncbi:monovalent cation:proton antiporter-2 (CPA2) family protein [Kiloniella laminariae]|uniref:Monovalent cation:proton antiporter-2 (CPA2) family protein n=1 Tax=Kiloniella laminariae TaxID=454162 RepID=A0ABT4LDG7_9PROT|nr:monovalent cation:proton antiporter-2 (CPA2) family protein [Kiloniella laminariae]MCZ4279146.1 monovalent cation:proton antiporter-2 (CPA2) family protein [Kiloniella laminariae]